MGHFINHPPKDTPANVTFLDVFVPKNFFIPQFQRFIPTIAASAKNNKIIKHSYDAPDQAQLVGVFALRDIKHGEELFVDYLDQSMHSLVDVPDWMVKPPPRNPYLVKYYYENKFTIFQQLVNDFLFRKYASVYQKFEKKVSSEPSVEARDKIRNDMFFKNLQQKKQKA